MKIVTLSDTHGFLPTNLPDGDCLVIAGDICPAHNHTVEYQEGFLDDRFNNWLDSLPYKHVVCIAGNHDWVFERGRPPFIHCNYLQDTSVVLDGVKFYGYPHTPMFCNWAFNETHENLVIAANKIPEDTDVLITHGPPYGILDSVTDPKWKNRAKDLGCKALRDRVDNLPNLKLSIFGHIHSSKGNKRVGDTTFVNASYINEQYEHTDDYNPFVVDI